MASTVYEMEISAPKQVDNFWRVHYILLAQRIWGKCTTSFSSQAYLSSGEE